MSESVCVRACISMCMWGGGPDCSSLSPGMSKIVPLYLQIESVGRESPCKELDFAERLGRRC